MLFFVMVCVSLMLVSCQSGTVMTEETAPIARDSGALAYQLSSQMWCTNDQACSMLLHLVDGQDPHENFDQRLVALDVKGMADASWDIQADQPVTKGTLAFMLCRALEIKGGVMMHLIPSRRYAYKEAVFQNLMLRGSENEPLTGPEAVGIFGRAAR